MDPRQASEMREIGEEVGELLPRIRRVMEAVVLPQVLHEEAGVGIGTPWKMWWRGMGPWIVGKGLELK